MSRVTELKPFSQALRGWVPVMALLVALLGTGVPLTGDEASPEPVIRVEEDWELVLNQPDDTIETPQFHTVMSPFVGTDSFYAQVLWNYREGADSFTPGGLQLQSWNGESRLNARNIFGQLLSTAAETITWTQVLETNGSELAFAIENGESLTWGTFGKDIRITANANLPDLSSYAPAASVENSCVTFGSNRVDSLVIKEVRRYGASGLISVDTTRRVVSELVDESDVVAD